MPEGSTIGTAQAPDIIRARRRALKRSQAVCAAQAGISRAYWCLIERGHIKNPSLWLARRVSGALGGVPIDELFPDEQQPAGTPPAESFTQQVKHGTRERQRAR